MKLSYLDIKINNSFVHVYARKGEANVVDGGYCSSWTSIQDRIIIKNASDHRMHNCSNHIMDIFCANSILIACLGQQTIDDLIKILGSKNITTIQDSLVFNLPDIENNSVLYRLRYCRIIHLLRKMLIKKE